jgi:Ca2+-binding RTX toxin-like protein
MGRKLGGRRRRDRRRGETLLITVVAVFGLTLAVAAGPAVAKKITGSNRSERIVGTKKSDRINGKGGNDLIKGRRGDDRLRGGKGRDLVAGGKGVDRLLGGRGNDVLKAADSRRDSVINGGPGADRCIVDAREVSIVRNCAKVRIVGGGGGGGSSQGLQVLTVDVMCSPRPDLLGCSFHITGDGADAAGPGSVEGSGGVTNVLGAAGSLIPPNWDALGGYTCTAAGSLRITIGSESADVPVPCAPG